MDAYRLAAVTRWNPWIEAPSASEAWISEHVPLAFVPRFPAIPAPSPDPARAVLVIGPRQAGKSTFLWSLLRDRHRRILLVQGDDPVMAEWCHSPAAFATDLDRLPERPDAIVIEEAQHLVNAGLFVKGLIDLKAGFCVYVTGSSSYHLRARVRESLAGRASRLRLYPLSLRELLAREGVVADDLRAESLAAPILGRLGRYGGYPGVYLHDREPQRLMELIEAFVLRDASDVFKVAKPAAFRTLLRLMAGQIGNLVNLTEWAGITRVAVSTVSDWAAILEECHVVRLLPVFAGGKRVELTASPKLYFLDNGVRNALVGDFAALDARADRGALFENLVFGELMKTLAEPDDLHYWRTKGGAEIDFVLWRQGSAPVAIEVKTDALPGRISRGARSFLEGYRPEVFLTVTMGDESEAIVDGVPCRWLKLHRLAGALPERFR
jgi:predicted AAA+ superfamily ATPase